MFPRLLAGILTICVATLSTVDAARAQEPAADADLARAGAAVLKKHCSRCHGVKFESERLNVLKRDSLVETANLPADEVYLAPGKPDDSWIWRRAAIEKDMPPGENERVPDEDLAILKKWIEAGAPFPAADKRGFLTESYVLSAIRDDVTSVAESDRRFMRYFTFTNLHNNAAEDRVGRNGTQVTRRELNIARAAFVKLINSLSWEETLVKPKIVDDPANSVVFRIDLRELGWDRDNGELWNEIVKLYPYAVRFHNDADEQLADLAREVNGLVNERIPYVRADWFIDAASRPPLYHEILEIPENAKELEDTLEVNVEADFLNDKLARAAFAKSGVSRHNRLVDRHEAKYGAYWKSYDFARSEGSANLFRFPLGPVFKDHPFEDQAFDHDGGEIIFNLPNGLQAYLLVDKAGKRIDAGPIKVVRDLTETSGTAEVLNGLSCMSCHDRGMKPLTDTVRGGLTVAGKVREKVRALYPSPEGMNELLAKDREMFLTAVKEITVEFLQAGEDKDTPFEEFPEPVGSTARLYQKDLELEELAAELGMSDPKVLAQAIRTNDRLKQGFGLGAVANGDPIKRSTWAAVKDDPTAPDSEIRRSLFHKASLAVDRGTPYRKF